ncbi:ester cyclase [Cerasicoccus frondis]|uniref:ester cyclase n=1 Tax=Cerasicoccus frondis TaxID=490090 RepID=UPI002852D9FA|nr:ester cyclase [Cerasicoccus frondis]
MTERQAQLEKLWQRHIDTEFTEKDETAAVDTMVADCYVNHVPVITGGVGREHVEYFYGKYFIPNMPDDVELVPVSRTIGDNSLADEFIFKCTHSVRMDWLLPGVEATGKKIELAKVVIIQFEGDKLVSEHIYWDHASLLVQVGLLDPNLLPTAGAECARKVLDPYSVPSNALIRRYVDDPKI